MSILEQLMEKKDLLIYIDVKISALRDNIYRNVSSSLIRPISCLRTNSLLLGTTVFMLLSIISSDKLKETSKKLWASANTEEVKKIKTASAFLSRIMFRGEG